MIEVNGNTYLNDWWIPGHTPVLNKRNRDRPIVDYLKALADRHNVSDEAFKQIMRQFMPRQSKDDENLLTIYKDSLKYQTDVATRGKPARMLQFLFPFATEKDKEAFAVWFKEVFVASQNTLTLHIGHTREDFKHGFTKIHRGSGDFDYHPDGNKIGIQIKSQADSCMRYAFPSLPAHPAEAYASGDWEIVTVRGPRGKVYARTVCCIKDGGHKFLPLYTSANKATRMILDYIRSLAYAETAYDLEGVRLLKIKRDHSPYYFVHPYIDNNRYTSYGTDYLYVSARDCQSYSSPDGYIYIREHEQTKPYDKRHNKPQVHPKIKPSATYFIGEFTI